MSLGVRRTLQAALKVNHTPHGRRRSLTMVKMLILRKIDLAKPMPMALAVAMMLAMLMMMMRSFILHH